MNRVQYRQVALSVTPCWVAHDFFVHVEDGTMTVFESENYPYDHHNAQ